MDKGKRVMFTILTEQRFDPNRMLPTDSYLRYTLIIDRTQEPQYLKTAILKNCSTRKPQSQKLQYYKSAVLKNRSTQKP